MDRPGPIERVGMKFDRWWHRPLAHDPLWYCWRIMFITWFGWAVVQSAYALLFHGDWSRLFFYLTWFAMGAVVGIIYSLFEFKFRRNRAEETAEGELRGTSGTVEGR